MKNLPLIIISFILFFQLTSQAQVKDDFEDGNLDGWGNISDWSNSNLDPINGSNSLKHGLVNIAANSYISRDLTGMTLGSKSVIWNFNLKNGDWDPSGTSKFWFYLLANESNLNSLTVDGYAVGVDFLGTTDILTIWKITNGVPISAIITSTFDWNSSDLVGISISRTASGQWTLKYDVDGNFDNLVTGGEANNIDYTFSDYCGLVFNITNAARAGQLWLDDLDIDFDNQAPQIESVVALNSSSLKIQFSEQLDQTQAESLGNYNITGLGMPNSAVLNPDKSSVQLGFASSFAEQIYNINISNIIDLSGNTMAPTTKNFTYTIFKPKTVYVIDKNEVIVEFSRNLNQISTETLINYSLNNGIGNPLMATLQSDKFVHLTFASDFENNTSLLLTINNLIDINGITIDPTNISFKFHQATPYDLVINEIMADPTPTLGLPEYEYLEIYNNTKYDISLYNWKLQIGTTIKNLPLTILKGNSYLLLSSLVGANSLEKYGKTIGILGSTDLTNAGKKISLISNEEIIIDSLTYSDTWYQDTQKDEGGWSLERIDPNNTCGRISNWNSSINTSGGSPGKINSIDNENIDIIKPKLLSIHTIASNQLELKFDEELDNENAYNINNYLIDNTIKPKSISLAENEISTFSLVYNTDFSLGSHNLKIKNQKDICGNISSSIDTSFTYYPGNKFDIVINEMLPDTNPHPNNLPTAKYIELYNKTGQNIDISGWKIQIGEYAPKLISDFVFNSKSYLILCAESKKPMFQTYGKTLGILSESQLTIAGTQISIYNAQGALIDSINYSNTWYQDTQKDDGGWSLERIDPDNWCGKMTNWKASIDTSGGTPGKINSIDNENIDNIGPQLLSVHATASNQLELEFDEELDITSAYDINNYTIDATIKPQTISLLENKLSTFTLSFNKDFSLNKHTLLITNLKDICGNLSSSIDTFFTYYPGNKFDIVINEIMVDTSPKPNILPAAKYLELFNRTNQNIDISGWKIQIGENTPKLISDFVFNSKSYLILCSESKKSLFQTYGKTLSILSESQLTISGTSISIYNAQGILIDSLNYSNTWYQDTPKEAGGWSLERIDPDNICGKKSNWKASIDTTGGTPGKINSIDNENIDNVAPKLLSVHTVASNQLELKFDEELASSNLFDINNYLIDNAIKPKYISIEENELSKFSLVFETDFSLGKHNLKINNQKDICGNLSQSIDTIFTYYLGNKFDIVINEIMADTSPRPNILPAAKYLELYNRTDQNIDISGWKIQIGENTPKLFSDFVFNSKSYLILCSESKKPLFQAYGNTLGILSESQLTITGNSISIYNAQGILIDSLNYSDTWYQDTQKDDGGWSLERIDPDNTCGLLHNWKASIDSTGGTPGKLNSIDNENIDIYGPKLLFVRAISSNQLELKFDEEINYINSINPDNYILNGTFKPQNIFVIENDPAIIVLDFENEFLPGFCTLQILNLVDICGNISLISDTTFSYYPGNEFDIIVNEIMADINPKPNVLPVAKYIELLNNTELNIDISGWKIQIDENAPIIIPEFILKSKTHLIVCSKTQLSNFQAYGNALGILTESELISSKASISVYNLQGNLIDYIKYSESWYGNEAKSEGGWSLERIDSKNYCGDAQNWKATVDFKGGTPGRENSVKSSNTDISIPVLKQSRILSSNKLELEFSKNISQTSAFESSNYKLDNGINLPVSINFSDTSRTTLTLQFAAQFIDGQQQTLKIQNLKDFCGNIIAETNASFIYHLIKPTGVFAESSKILHIIFSEEVEVVTAETSDNYTVNTGFGNPTHAYKHAERKNEVYLEFPDELVNGNNYSIHIENVKDLSDNAIKSADLLFNYFVPNYNDLIINEVLFNPKPNGFDFIEIYNKSNQAIDLSKLSIASMDEEGITSQAKVLSSENKLLLPGHFLAIANDTNQIKNEYPAMSYDKFIQILSMPSYSDDKGEVVLLADDEIVDKFAYNDNMHFALITNTEGISLERIDPEKPTQIVTNWHSAAESVGFATPANQNSQFRKSGNESNDEIIIEPETFSPNNDGFEDQLLIHYKFEVPGYVANVTVYDGKGRIVRKIAASEMLGVEGELSWDGLLQDNTKARIGIYLVYFEVFNLLGEVKKFKRTCVLAGRLD